MRDLRLAPGLFWTIWSTLVGKIVVMLAKVLVATLIAPEDLGLVAMTLVALGLAYAVAEFGLQVTLVQRRGVGLRALADSCFWLLMLTCAGLTVIGLLAVVPMLVNLTGEPRIEAPAQTMVLVLWFQCFSIVPAALLTRQRKLRQLALAEWVGVSSGAAAAIWLATSGQGLWSLIAQQFVSAAVTAALVWRSCRWWPSIGVSGALLRKISGFSASTMLTRLIVFLKGNVDIILVSALLGPGAVGGYIMALTFSESIRSSAAFVVSRIVLPILSRQVIQTDALRRSYLRATGLMSLLVSGPLICVILFADIICGDLLGPQWSSSSDPMRVLAIGGIGYALSGPAVELLQAMGRARELLRMATANFIFVTIPVTGILSWQFGTIGAASAFTGALLAHRITLYSEVRVAIRLRASDSFRCWLLPVGITIACTALAFAVDGKISHWVTMAGIILVHLLAAWSMVRRGRFVPGPTQL